MWNELYEQVKAGDHKALARAISLVENEYPGYDEFMRSLKINQNNIVIGITGPPGAGKSTLTDALIGVLAGDGKKVCVLCVDPSSPFNLGAVLGDRIRMSAWYNNPQVFIRSLASRGSVGGLHAKIIEFTDIAKAAGFDFIIIETVGVGQSEIEIAGLADSTVVVLVPESGDEVQTMKSGLMEIADIFVVNKADRPGADTFINNLRMMLAPAFHNHKVEVPVMKTIASQNIGVSELKDQLMNMNASRNDERKSWLLAEKAFQLIRNKRMKDVDKHMLADKIKSAGNDSNLYSIIENF